MAVKFQARSLRALGEMVVGDVPYFPRRSSMFITEFFADCGFDFRHTGETRWRWAADRLEELLKEPQPRPNTLPPGFAHVLRMLLDKGDAQPEDPDRAQALAAINVPLNREGYEAFYDERRVAHLRHVATDAVSENITPHRPFTQAELQRRELLQAYLERCSEDNLIGEVLLPMFRKLGYHRITSAGHKDKALEYGKDVWMRYVLPTQHVIYFGVQVKKDKLDASGLSKGGSRNIAEIHHQALMMLGHEVFDPELSRRVLVDHAFIISGGEITKAARNWLGEQLDKVKRSQIMFMDREDILNLFIAANVPLPSSAEPQPVLNDGLPF